MSLTNLCVESPENEANVVGREVISVQEYDGFVAANAQEEMMSLLKSESFDGLSVMSAQRWLCSLAATAEANTLADQTLFDVLVPASNRLLLPAE